MGGSVLVTGGAGYIGSHTCLALIRSGWTPVILDNFSNSNAESVARLNELTGSDIALVKGDIRDAAVCAKALREYDCESVIHFAGLKAVGESQSNALEYYDVNVIGSHRLIEAMREVGVDRLIFSSSATVYGMPETLPLDESHPLAPVNPYGQTKRVVEDMIADVANSSVDLSYGILRYFNPVGADVSGMIGEDPRGTPNNLMPIIAQVGVGRRELLSVYGDDYETVDGTGVRDYIHVSDLAEAHVSALSKLFQSRDSYIVNLGTGQGFSVLQVVEAFERVSGRKIPYQVVSRRPGDVDTVLADPAYAERLLGWKAKHGLDAMCRDHWNWQSANPSGYGS